MRLVCDRVGPSWSNLHAWSWSGGRCSIISCFGTQWFAWCVGVSFVVVRGPTKGKCWQLTRRRMPKVGGAPTAGRKWSLVALRWCNGLSCCTRLAAFVVSRRTSAILFKLVVGGLPRIHFVTCWCHVVCFHRLWSTVLHIASRFPHVCFVCVRHVDGSVSWARQPVAKLTPCVCN